MEKIPVAAIVGPTASGKTALAAELALRLDGEVISADSMQIYKGMDIATAKPTADEMRGVVHHMIGFLEPDEAFSVARYCELARPVVRDVHDRGKLPIVAGGTGLYIDSLLNNVSFVDADSDPDLRSELMAVCEEKGVSYLLDMLAGFDPESAGRLAPQRNPKRIIRAIEVYRTTGMTATQLNETQTSAESPFKAVRILLTADDREYLYDRIDRRVDIMLGRGLLDEARRFFDSQCGSTASAAIGYKELRPYIEGSDSLDNCVERLKRATRRYAKRQLTWFTRDNDTHRLSIDRMSFSQLADTAERIIKDSLNE